MKRTKIKSLLSAEGSLGSVCLKGWIKTRRDAKSFSFIELNDGSCLENIQVIADANMDNYETVKKLTTGSAVSVVGEMASSPGKEQTWEIHAKEIEVFNFAPEDYPLQKKRHTDEFLRTIAHLRPRTNKYGAMFRIRSELTYAVYTFFRERGFHCIHTPILTGSDCEGAGELFQVTTLDLSRAPWTAEGPDYRLD